jgi:hypothetical protein
MATSRIVLAVMLLVAVIAIAWVAWAWLSGGFCTPPPGAACL